MGRSKFPKSGVGAKPWVPSEVGTAVWNVTLDRSAADRTTGPSVVVTTCLSDSLRVANCIASLPSSWLETRRFPVRSSGSFCNDKKKCQIYTYWQFTLFENYSKCRIWIFEFWHFPPIFVLLKVTCLVTLFDRKLQVFKNLQNWTIFGICNGLLSTQNVDVARCARNVEWDFFCDFQIPCVSSS